MGFEMPMALLLVVPLLYLWWRLGRGPRAVWPLRCGLLALAAVIFAGPVLTGGRRGRNVVLVVDRSLSAGKKAVAAAAEMFDLLSRAKADRDRLSIVTFGAGACPVTAAEDASSAFKASSFDDASDLHAGLRLAAALCGGRGGSVVLVTDGLYTGPDPMELVPALRRRSAKVLYWPVQSERRNDVSIRRVELPERVRVGRPYEMIFEVDSPAQCRAVVRIGRGRELAAQSVTLSPGTNRFAVRDVAPTPGLVLRSVEVTAEGDSCPQNNRALAVTEAVGPPEVLVVNSTGAPDNLSEALRSAGFRVRIVPPDIPISSAFLKPFEAVVLENVPLSSMSERADAALRNYVVQLGGGLLVTGGKSSYAAGGYYRSRLEDVLPVSMERKEHYRRPRLAMAIVLDRSGSMMAPVPGGLTKMDLADRAAAEAVGLLAEQDEVAVLAVDSEAHVEVPLTRLQDRYDRVQKRILSIESMGGGIFVYNGLSAAVRELLRSDAPTRHIALFADAADSEQPGDYRRLVSNWTAAGGTISVIGLGTERDQDAEFLKDIARLGGGTAAFTSDPHALPRIFCQDAMRIARKTFIEQQTRARVTPLIARLGKLRISQFPSFLGYNLCYPRPGASTLVLTTDEYAAPVLAVWQRGLGKAAALTCEADGPFSGELLEWSRYREFLAGIVGWLRRERDDPSLFGSLVRRGRTATVLLEMDERAAGSCAGATALIIGPDESEPTKLPLHWTSPRTMQADLKLTKNGIYHGLIVTSDGKRVSMPPAVLPYSPEFEPQRPGAGLELLQKLAETTGGHRLMHVREALAAAAAPRTGEREVSLVPPLAGLMIVLLLCEIVTRKSLWRQLVPQAARRRSAAAVRGIAAAPSRLLRAIRRRRRPLRPTGAEEPEAQPEPAPEPSGEEPAETVFEKAKRRARR